MINNIFLDETRLQDILLFLAVLQMELHFEGKRPKILPRPNRRKKDVGLVWFGKQKKKQKK
jgi:hypothetical protein